MKKHITILIIILLSGFKLLAQDTNVPAKITNISHRFQGLDRNTNIMYSPSFRAAWTMLVNNILEEPVLLRPTLPLAEELNKYKYIAGENTDWITESGLIEEGIIEKLDRQMLERYNRKAPGLEDARKAREGILCYSYLSINALFEKAFEKISWNFYPNDTAEQVHCFGVSKGKTEEKVAIRKQVTIYDYRNPDDFILRLTPSDSNLEIIISEMSLEKNIYETIKELNRRINESFDHKLSSGDELIIPGVAIDYTYSYKDLLGRYLKNKGFEDYFFTSAVQRLNLSLDQRGALAEVSGKILLKKGPVPRIYSIDRPFILLIRKVGSEEPLVFVRIRDSSWLNPCEKN